MNIWTKENIINYTSDPDEANDNYIIAKVQHSALRELSIIHLYLNTLTADLNYRGKNLFYYQCLGRKKKKLSLQLLLY